MKAETRRRILRYGIAIDLVILATAIGLLLPAGPTTILLMFVVAAAVGAWKGGPIGGALAIGGALIASLYFFPQTFDGTRLIALVVASVVAVAIVGAAAPGGRLRMRLARPAGGPLIDTIPMAELDAARERTSREHADVAHALERAAVTQLDDFRKRRESAPAPDAAPLEAVPEPEQVAEPVLEPIPEPVAIVPDVMALEAARQQLDREVTERFENEIAEHRRKAEAELHYRIDAELSAMAREVEERVARELAGARRNAEERVEEERRRLAEELERRMEEERTAFRTRIDDAVVGERAAQEQRVESELASARELIESTAAERIAADHERIQRAADEKIAVAKKAAEEDAARRVHTATKPSLLDTVTGWLRKAPRMNLAGKRVATNTVKRRASPVQQAPVRKSPVERKPRLLMLERRRAMADTVAPRLKTKGMEVEIVERWIDAVDELFRFRPDAIFIDSELPELERIHKTITDQAPRLPVFITGRSPHGFNSDLRYALFVARPYDPEQLAKIAREAMESPQHLLSLQSTPRVAPSTPRPAPQIVAPPPPPRPVVAAAPPPAPATVEEPAPAPIPAAAPQPTPPMRREANEDSYEVVCFNCRIGFDATDADWCSCLAKERTFVCTNCLTCFCKAPPSFKERFWLDAPPRLFERKSEEAKRNETSIPDNPGLESVRRPLVLSVEDDDDIQRIVRRVCDNLGYGFIRATNGQDGLDLARQYRPNLILSDAFMPKLDGREMCRIIKEEEAGKDMKTVVMTGLYTDTKYRSEALKRFHVDDYLAKPVSITDLINLLQKHLEGVTGLPQQEDLHSIHRAEYEEDAAEAEEPVETEPLADDGVPLAKLLAVIPKPPKPRRDAYEVCCFTCNALFDATRSEWCKCIGRDQTVVCTECSNCFCKAPSVYKERFWVDAPPSLFERKMISSKRNTGSKSNVGPRQVKRPLILLVEDDENIQLIVKTVVTTMGYGFIVGANGQEGLALAREYNPDLILSDAFMPKLDGREMCRLLKEDPSTSRSKAIIMTGLYTDRKYRNEALDYFKVDDYVAKPVAVDDLIKLFKKHLPQEVQTTM
jgi:CheY-like chemotaxis protein